MMVGSVLKSLHERGLIDVTGRGEGLGRPLLYGTTPVFLEYFGLRHLEELPRGDELAIALRAPIARTHPPSIVPTERTAPSRFRRCAPISTSRSRVPNR